MERKLHTTHRVLADHDVEGEIRTGSHLHSANIQTPLQTVLLAALASLVVALPHLVDACEPGPECARPYEYVLLAKWRTDPPTPTWSEWGSSVYTEYDGETVGIDYWLKACDEQGGVWGPEDWGSDYDSCADKSPAASWSAQHNDNSGNTSTLASYTFPAGPGHYTMNATHNGKTCTGGTCGPCTLAGASFGMDVYVCRAELKSIKFTSDHGMLTDNNSDWTDDDDEYEEPEWVRSSGRNNPISHNRNQTLAIQITAKVEPSGLSYYVFGNGLNNYVDFTSGGRTSTGSDETISISASGGLPGIITILSEAIWWDAILTVPNLALDMLPGQASSGPHKIYLTAATPSGSDCTEKRLNWACTKASTKVSPEQIADAIYNAIGDPVDPPYDPVEKGSLGSGWPLLAGDTYGECDDQAELMMLALKILGISAQLKLVRASTNSGAGNCLDYQYRYCPVHGDEWLMLDFY
ncbi:MAG: hypothetical protein ABIH23_17025, partial [bacterium]